MSESFNPYRDWLGLDGEVLQASAGAPNFYQLIGLKESESDQQRIVRAVDRAQALVRSHRPGPYARQWAELLDQLKQARATLTDPSRKAQYDQSLRQHGERDVAQPHSSSETATAAPQEVVVPEAANEMSLPHASSQFAWPPGMGPRGGEDAAETKPAETQPAAAAMPAAQQPAATATLAPATQHPTAPAADAIPLSARWPVPDAQAALPSSVAAVSTMPPAEPPANLAPAAPAHPVPMAVPLAALGPTHGSAPLARPLGEEPPMAFAAQHPPAPPPPGMTDPANVPYGSIDPMAPAQPWHAPVSPAVPRGTAVPDGAGGFAEVASGVPVGMAVGHEWTQTGPDAGGSVSIGQTESAPVTRRSKSGGNSTVVLAVVTAILLVVGAAVIFGGRGEDQPKQVADNSSSLPAIDDSQLRPMRTEPRETTAPPRAAATPPDVPPAPSPPAQAPPPPEVAPAAPMQDPEPAAEEMAPTVQPPLPTEAEPQESPSPTEPPAAADPAMVPMPAPVPTTPPATPPTDQEIARLSQLLTTTRQALTDQNVAEAKQSIAQAVELAKAPSHVAKAERLQSLTMLISEFWRAVDESLKGLQGGDVITVANTQVAIVEVTPEVLIIRLEGQNKRYPRNDMPEGLAMGLADSWLDQNSEVTPLVRGAFYAVARQGDPQRAQAQWQQAAARGFDLADLPKVLTDKYDIATLKADAAQMAAAQPAAPAPTNGSLTEADKQAVAAALRAAREALSRAQLDDADAQLTIAANVARGSELEPVVKRTQALAGHVRGFWEAVASGMERLTPGAQLTIGSTQVTIVASSREAISYQVAGIDRSHRRSEIPAGLAMALAKSAMNEDATAALRRGAFYAVAPKGDPADARNAWNEAFAAGGEVGDLMLTLDDTYQW